MRPLVIRTLVIAFVVTSLTAMAIMVRSYHYYSQRCVARLVGIDTYGPISDLKLNDAVKQEYPIGMTEQVALEKLRERGLYKSSWYIVNRHLSEDDSTTESFVVIVPSSNLSFVQKEFLLLLEFDVDSHRIKHSAINHGFVGF